MKYDVFISFKNSGKDGKPTPDTNEARHLYEALKGIGLKVFFSEESLEDTGLGHFSKAIEAALDSARILVLVASCREHIESRWVEAEWDSFLHELRSGNKQGELYILNCGKLRSTDLPLFLRRQQMFPAADIKRLVRFIANAIPARKTIQQLVNVSLHCLRPERKEDKVYMLAVHTGTEVDRYHVTAYWGARSAKRLSSQMKAINATPEEASAVVEKSRQEKLRVGYRPKPIAKLITSEARSQILASLGISVAHAVPGSRKGAHKPSSRSTKKDAVTEKNDVSESCGATSAKQQKPIRSAGQKQKTDIRNPRPVTRVDKKAGEKKAVTSKKTSLKGGATSAATKLPRKRSK